MFLADRNFTSQHRKRIPKSAINYTYRERRREPSRRVCYRQLAVRKENGNVEQTFGQFSILF